MRDQQQSDEVTLAIGSALLLFAGVLVGVSLALWGVGALVGDDDLWQRGVGWVALVAGLVCITYLYRHRRG
jgi:hypothetical protein